DTSFHFRQRSHVVDVAALDGDDLALADPPAREESFALYGTLADAGLRRQIGRGHREPSASAGRRAEHEVSVFVHHGGPAWVHEGARVGFLDDGGARENVAAQELAAVEDRGRLKAARLREPDVALAFPCARGCGPPDGQG